MQRIDSFRLKLIKSSKDQNQTIDHVWNLLELLSLSIPEVLQNPEQDFFNKFLHLAITIVEHHPSIVSTALLKFLTCSNHTRTDENVDRMIAFLSSNVTQYLSHTDTEGKPTINPYYWMCIISSLKQTHEDSVDVFNKLLLQVYPTLSKVQKHKLFYLHTSKWDLHQDTMIKLGEILLQQPLTDIPLEKDQFFTQSGWVIITINVLQEYIQSLECREQLLPILPQLLAHIEAGVNCTLEAQYCSFNILW